MEKQFKINFPEGKVGPDGQIGINFDQKDQEREIRENKKNNPSESKNKRQKNVNNDEQLKIDFEKAEKIQQENSQEKLSKQDSKELKNKKKKEKSPLSPEEKELVKEVSEYIWSFQVRVINTILKNAGLWDLMGTEHNKEMFERIRMMLGEMKRAPGAHTERIYFLEQMLRFYRTLSIERGKLKKTSLEESRKRWFSLGEKSPDKEGYKRYLANMLNGFSRDFYQNLILMLNKKV